MIIIVGIVILLLVGGGIYLWQQKNQLKTLLNQTLAEKNTLQEQTKELNQEKNALQEQIKELTKKPERYVKIISPNGGEVLCLNKNFTISWDSKGVNLISLNILRLEGGGRTSYPLETFPATVNETGEKNTGKGEIAWKIGSTRGGIKLGEGYGYKIEITSADGILINDASDNVFQILICEG